MPQSLPPARGSHWSLCFLRTEAAPNSKQLMQFLLLPLGTGCQKLCARCQAHSQAYQSVPGVKDFIPPEHTPEGEVASGWIPSCFQAASHHVWSRVNGRIMSKGQSTAGLPPSKLGLVRRPERSPRSQRDAWLWTGSQTSRRHYVPLNTSCPREDKFLES